MHPLLYCLFLALRPRMLMTVDEAGEPLPAAVRVGQAVDVVAQAGRPKTVTGFQTHDAPVLLAAKQRAELGTERYVAHTQVLEDVVVLSRNPDWVQRDE
ncbi:hypothetical protein H632_c1344p1 [Helicosporidium sp. ATCC 50920]|nr:hypothetical protein H632_c1344p1 [Helicosporidium sp. ATCC 50920]|eukprot:KDD74396.1 hypothetical protein H632_c1344p1 [Helicosporidium sp. ATCC 50920]